jgi:predicted DNA-binding WGR domain protein
MRLEFHGGSSSKFWEPRVAGRTLTVRFGKIGTAGQTRDTVFATPAAAKTGLAKLLAEKTGKGYRPAKAGAKATAASAAKPPPKPPAKATARRTALLALAKALGGSRAAAVVRDVTLAVDDPARFLATTKHELFEDWDDDDTAEVPWLALIEALAAAGRLAEADWKEAGRDMLAALGRIGGAPAARALRAADDADLDLRRTDEALALFGKLLGAARLALVVLDKNSDSFPLMVVSATEVPALVALARAAGTSIKHWTGKDLAKLEAERARADARDRSKNPWRMLVVEHAHQRGTETEAESVLFQLRHDRDGSLLERIRAAVPFAPARDRPLIELALALNDRPASRIARTTPDPALCLRALNNVHDDGRSERLGAAAILAARLDLKPDGGTLHRQLGEVLNLWEQPKVADAALARLPAADRDRLARLADGLIRKGLYGLSGALRALANVGDATSLELLTAIDQRERARAAAHAKKHPSWSAEPWSDETDMPGTLARIRARVRKRG